MTKSFKNEYKNTINFYFYYYLIKGDINESYFYIRQRQMSTQEM